jgi:hypothetical protein
MHDTSTNPGAASARGRHRLPVHLLVAALGISVLAAGASGCGAASKRRVSQPSGPAGSFSATPLVTRSYGISQWRTLYGSNWMVVSGVDSAGNAVRGIEVTWFPSSAATKGYTRLKLLDGSGATLRRFVDGSESGHLSTQQIAFIQAARSDLKRPGASLRKRSSSATCEPDAPSRDGRLRSSGVPAGDSRAALTGSNPSEGPLCMDALLDPALVVDGVGCAFGAVTFETVLGGLEAAGSCTQWYLETRHANQVCAQENALSCSGNPPTCNFDPNATPPPSAPAPACDEQCMCANFGIYDGKPCLQTCVTKSDCPGGQTCHWGSCGPAGADDAVRDELLGAVEPWSSCGEGGATVSPDTGEVGCVLVSDGGAQPGTSPGGADGGTSGFTLTCVNVGEACGPSDVCCVGNCTDGLCPNLDFSLELPACKFTGDPCTGNWECCTGGDQCLGGTCTPADPDTCSRFLGDPCDGDLQCCSKKCDPDSHTCVAEI